MHTDYCATVHDLSGCGSGSVRSGWILQIAEEIGLGCLKVNVTPKLGEEILSKSILHLLPVVVHLRVGHLMRVGVGVM